MFRIESYVTPILLSYVDKYVKDFKPADAQVSLWGGGVALHNLVLKADVLQQEVALPFTLVSGRIHELLIQVPWTKIMSEPIVVTIDTIECVLSLNPPTTNDESAPPDSPSRKTHVVETPPGYMQALVRRIVSNIALRVHHLIVKYVQDDIVMSLNVKHLAVDSAGPTWEPSFADIDPGFPVVRRLVTLDDLTLCLDRADADGKIRYYQEPLLYRCQLDLRVLTRLVSANTRRARSLSIQMRSSKLAWGVTNDQLTLLLRLVRERTVHVKPPTPAPRAPNSVQNSQLNPSSSNVPEPARSESWSEWAWSWLPTWMDRDGVEEAPTAPAPIPVNFTAFLDDVSLVFKVMELDNNTRKRARSILEINAAYAAIKSFTCAPTVMRVHIGTRTLNVISKGKCVCGHIDYNASNEEPTVYLTKISTEPDEDWTWPEDQIAGVELATAVDEYYRFTPDITETREQRDTETQMSDHGLPEEPTTLTGEQRNEAQDFWSKMGPLLFIEHSHERMPPNPNSNPYENPPIDFQYSDWVEESITKITIKPVEVYVCMGLIHRLNVLKTIFQELPPVPTQDIPLRVLTVEECEALTENLPQQRITLEALGMRVRLIPWDHSQSERPSSPPLYLDLDLPKNIIVVNGPLYPIRVCIAACQMPEDNSPIWQGARLHLTVNTSVAVAISSPTNKQARSCARAEIKAVAHTLLNSHLFNRKRSVLLGFSVKIVEANVCGSFARLLAAVQVPLSLFRGNFSNLLRYTSLPFDALNDEESVAIDLTLEDMVIRGYRTAQIRTYIVILQSAKATALHDMNKGEEVKQAWLFSAPDAPTSSPYLRLAVQWCVEPLPYSIDYVGVWTEPTAVAVDPLFVAWLAYKPIVKATNTESNLYVSSIKSVSSTQFFTRRKITPPSSSGRGGSKSGSGADNMIHRTRSAGSSEKAESKERKRSPNQEKEKAQPLLSSERMLALHERLRRLYVNFELGLTLVYVTMTSASALDCATIRDAMERHASYSEKVLAISLGRTFIFSSLINKQFWHEINHDGPTFITEKKDAPVPQGFPWRMRLADISCYTLETSRAERHMRDKKSTGLRSQLKTFDLATPRTVLELVTTTVTLSVVTKSLQYKTMPKPEPKVKTEPPKAGEAKLKYFKGGLADFKPTTLKEFVRGPATRKKSAPEAEPEKKSQSSTEPIISTGPLISVGINIHADTPPLKFRLEHDQVRVVSTAVHCFAHIISVLQSTSINPNRHMYTSFGSSHRSLARSVSEVEEGDETASTDTVSENKSELISIFEARSAIDNSVDVKTFFWFQWVVSRVTLVIATHHVKLVFDIDDIISTIDLQNHYNQLKVKVASASIRYFQRTGSDDWTAGVLGGRVLEAREPTNAKEDNHFLSVTITQAKISNLPASWKQELHPKLLEEKTVADSMWEIYATLAPLEAVIQPKILKHIHSVVHEMSPRSFCPLNTDHSLNTRPGSWQWPFLYVTAGGLRLLVTREHECTNRDDTFVFVMGRATISPHPENPICRRAVNSGPEWMTPSGGFEGRQYEVIVKHIAVKSAMFRQLVDEENSQAEMLKSGTGVENPAVKWSQPIVAPVITPILHSVDIGCVIAPAYYNNGILVCGPAVEFNLVSDCAIELSLDQLFLARKIVSDINSTFRESEAAFIPSEQDISSTLTLICPYAPILLTSPTADASVNRPSIVSEDYIDELPSTSETLRSVAADSGVDSIPPSTLRSGIRLEESSIGGKKTVSIAFVEQTGESSEYLEVFVTMGMIEVSLYTSDDKSEIADSLRPPAQFEKPATPEQGPELARELSKGSKRSSDTDNESADSPMQSRQSLTENVRNMDIGKTKLEQMHHHARYSEGNLPLIHLTLYQPNLYYWRKKAQKTLQVSLFNAWLGLGAGQIPGQWHEDIFTTAQGVRDPVTDIRPALATIKLVWPFGPQSVTNIATRGIFKTDIERPIMFEVSSDRLRRLNIICQLVTEKFKPKTVHNNFYSKEVVKPIPYMYKLKRMLLHNSIDNITIQMSQVAVCCKEGVAGWDSASAQFAVGGRPERLIGRGFISSFVVSAGPPGDTRHVVLQPLMLGIDFQATWEAWRKAEGGISAREPMVRVSLELDRMTLDIRPQDLVTLTKMYDKLSKLPPKFEETSDGEGDSSAESLTTFSRQNTINLSSISLEARYSTTSVDTTEEHFYKDDLRSGAFKIVSGGPVPMAYQVTLHNNAVSWRYPHPRAITRLVAYPLPGQDTETPCVLELYDSQLNRWDKHTNFKIPVGEPIEMLLYVPPPDAVFAVMWRYRTCYEGEEPYRPYKFDINRFIPKADPFQVDQPPDPPAPKCECGVSAEELSGVVRVDSCFSPRVAPRVRFVTRVARFSLHLHNEQPNLCSKATALEGYYVSKPLMRSHRVLTIAAYDLTAHAHLASPAGTLLLLDTKLLSDCLDCTTGTMEPLVEEFHFEGGLSISTSAMTRARVSLSHVFAMLHVPRLRTLHALVKNWKDVVDQYRGVHTEDTLSEDIQNQMELSDFTAESLEGLISLWIHNSCATSLRVGQEGTDEVVPLGSGASLAYRWRTPNAPKHLRFAIASPSTDWHWSNSVPFSAGAQRVRLHESGQSSSNVGAYLYIKTEEIGARRNMILSGRLVLANMLRYHLHYKVRGRTNNDNNWRTLCSGEIGAETLGKSVICGVDAEMALKVKFVNQDTGWSGDIPLRECPKENVPWLVKVPSETEGQPYMSVWCRVVRARSDGRILAAIWPLYVLYSHLPLDADVVIETEGAKSSLDVNEPPSGCSTIIQAAPGRGTCTHLLAPGTTAARHTLSFQYRNIECPVTREAVPLHYGVTDTSVFEKRPPIISIDEVMQETSDWLKHSSLGVTSSWPYSIVTKHWPDQWIPALIQPRCDVVVRYQAVRAGGGCSLEVLLCPVVLLCNAAPIALTLRAHDAAPLCKLEPGTAISPPSAILKKSFFISVEMGRDTFVSGELSVSGAELGRYGAPPPGRVALDRPAELAIQCNHKVALLTMYYEIKEDINILGMSSTYVLINSMETDISISAIAVPSEETNEDTVLRPNMFKNVVPTKDGSIHGMSLCRFWVWGRWRGSDPGELRLYLFIALPSQSVVRSTPIRLGHPPVRRAIALNDINDTSVPVVVTQIKHEGRWVVRVARDPCPQLVVHNRTTVPLAVAQPTARSHDEPTTSRVTVQQECVGTRWFCVIGPGAVTHYSTPQHCLRYPPMPNSIPNHSSIAFLTFAKNRDDIDPDWCAPVAATDGEQLLQLNCGMTVKLRVRTHPHSTHLELRDVDEHDISASDIRKRLTGAFYSTSDLRVDGTETTEILERVDGDNKLLGSKTTIDEQVSTRSASNAKSSTVPVEKRRSSPGSIVLLAELEQDYMQESKRAIRTSSVDSMEAASVFREVSDPEWDETASWSACDRIRIIAASIVVALSSAADAKPLVALHIDRAAVLVKTDPRRTKMTISVGDLQIDNLQYESGQFDFGVVATTRDGTTLDNERNQPLWNLFAEKAFMPKIKEAKALLRLTYDSWTVLDYNYRELTEVEISVGPLALYIEDLYVTSIARLWRRVNASADLDTHAHVDDGRSLQRPLSLRSLHIHPLDLTLTLHTAVRMYIALDQSPLRLSAFKLHDAMTSAERLTHALTVHYLSAAILGAGWVVGGLELLGAPGALAARVGGARGGVRGVASAAAAALLKSLSAWAGSLARNLDLLAGDEEHARRAAAARRKPPPSFMAGLAAGITNFAINILGAVGGLAHHPLVGVVVGESDSSATALRRGLLGALAKPLSATADLVAFAGHGLLSQTGWDPVPQPRSREYETTLSCGWRRDCVRWSFRLSELTPIAGFHVLLGSAPLRLLLTHRFLVVADPDSERIVEMIDLKSCSIGPYQGEIIELLVKTPRRNSRTVEARAVDEDDEFQISATAMARVARYTGTEGTSTAVTSEVRVLSLLPAPGQAHSLHAALTTAVHNNADSHFPLL